MVETGSKDPAGYDLVVNATPLGMKEDDPLPFDVARIAPSTFVGEVVMKSEFTPLLRAVREKGCADFLALASSLAGKADFVHVGPSEHDQSDALSETEVAAAAAAGTVRFIEAHHNFTTKTWTPN